MLSLHLSIPLRSATPREGTVGSDTKAERNGDVERRERDERQRATMIGGEETSE